MQTAEFGADFRQTAGMTYTGQLVIADPVDGCTALKTYDYTDKIVLVRASANCHYCRAAVFAQTANAKGVMIESPTEQLIYMPPQDCGQLVQIPAIMIQKSSGVRLRTAGYANADISYPVCPQWNGLAPGFGLEECEDSNPMQCFPQVCLWNCGNGVVAPPEECDDHNKVNGDGCSVYCLVERFEPPTEPLNAKIVTAGLAHFTVSWEAPAEGRPTGG